MAGTLLDPTTLRKLDSLAISTKRAFHGSRIGGHRSPARGQGMEFAEYRHYIAGDNPRHIDWGVYGRTDKLYVRTFQEERNLSVLIHLDSSNSMNVPQDPEKWRYAISIASALAYIGIREGERVAISSGTKASKASIGSIDELREVTNRLTKYASQSEPSTGVIEEQRNLNESLNRLATPGVGVIISDFLYPPTQLKSLLMSFTARKFDLTAIQVIGESDLNPFGSENRPALAIDSETGEEATVSLDAAAYQEELRTHSLEMARACELSGAKFVSTRPQEDLFDFLTRSLRRSGILR